MTKRINSEMYIPMNKRTIAKLIYFDAIPIIVGMIAFYYINKINDMWEYMKAVGSFLLMCIPLMMIHTWIGNKIFPEKPTLADKIVRCRLRRKYGNSYCVECDDSYNCASNIESGKGEKHDSR